VLLSIAVTGCARASRSDGGVRPGAGRLRHLLIVLDGLRPDYVTAELMPNLRVLGSRGTVVANHHAVYPTVTRVNASSIATGAYPETHGLLGNEAFFPSVDPARFFSTGERENLLAIEHAEQGHLLTAPTLGEQLRDAGHSLLVVSAGSTGSSFLLNHTVTGEGIIHYDYALPPDLRDDVIGVVGSVPDARIPNDGVTAMWLTRCSRSASPGRPDRGGPVVQRSRRQCPPTWHRSPDV